MNSEDRLAIAETLARHGHVADHGDLHALDTVFTSDTVYDMSAVGLPVMTGIAALHEGALRLAAHNPVAHHVTNIVILSADDDQAAVDSKGLMLFSDGTVQSVTHHDIVHRTGAGWRIASRVIVPQRVPLGGLTATPVSA
jgi:3-phenylpropionate/cinnamic acid dioxygenase small subunit